MMEGGDLESSIRRARNYNCSFRTRKIKSLNPRSALKLSLYLPISVVVSIKCDGGRNYILCPEQTSKKSARKGEELSNKSQPKSSDLWGWGSCYTVALCCKNFSESICHLCVRISLLASCSQFTSIFLCFSIIRNFRKRLRWLDLLFHHLPHFMICLCVYITLA